eukprot:363609-Chlamydomonas_euryale.AAC.17
MGVAVGRMEGNGSGREGAHHSVEHWHGTVKCRIAWSCTTMTTFPAACPHTHSLVPQPLSPTPACTHSLVPQLKAFDGVRPQVEPKRGPMLLKQRWQVPLVLLLHHAVLRLCVV